MPLPSDRTPSRRAWSRHRKVAAIVLAVSVALSSCRAGSVTAGDDVRVRFVDPQGRLAAIRPLADSVVAQTLRRVEGELPIAGVVVTVHADGALAIGGYGFGGRTFSAREVRLYIDPAFPSLATLVPSRLGWLAAHELHHAARWRSVGYGTTLLEAMISEGMADRYAEELLGDPLPPWSVSFAAESTAHYLSRAQAEFDSRTYDHAAWFFDASPSLPRWTAYTLGYRLVTAYLATHAGETARTLVTAPASRFRP